MKETLKRTIQYATADGVHEDIGTINVGDDGIMRNLEEWEKNKAPILDLLSHHPLWDAEKMAIIDTITEVREFSRRRIVDSIDNLLRWSGCDQDEEKKEARSQLYRLKFFNTPNISKGTIELYNKRVEAGTLSKYLAEHKPAVGQKTTRYLRKIFTDFGINCDKGEGNTRFSNISALFNTTEENFKIVLSVHPSDYMTQSIGNSWTSCHDLAEGCYRRGTLSYMNDPSTIVSYILPENWETEYPDRMIAHVPKTKRRMIHMNIKNGSAIFSTLYPGGTETFRNTQAEKFREILGAAYAGREKIMAEDVQWEVLHGAFSDNFVGGRGGEYPDYHYGAGETIHKIIGYIPPENTSEKNEWAKIGSDTFCLNCGDEITDYDCLEVNCDACQDHDNRGYSY